MYDGYSFERGLREPKGHRLQDEGDRRWITLKQETGSDWNGSAEYEMARIPTWLVGRIEYATALWREESSCRSWFLIHILSSEKLKLAILFRADVDAVELGPIQQLE